MNYYKLVGDGSCVGVVTENDFRIFQRKHQIILACDESIAQYVQYGESFYRANWMVPVTTDRVAYDTVEVIRIDKAEYDILCESIQKGEDIVVEQEQQITESNTEYTDPADAVTIDFVRSTKIAEMNYECNKKIESGIDVLLEDNKVYHFSLTTQDQLNLITMRSMVDAGESIVPYHADGERCRYYSASDMRRIIDKAGLHTTFNVTYCNSLKEYIRSLNDINEIASVRYGTEVPESYQSEVLKNMCASGTID